MVANGVQEWREHVCDVRGAAGGCGEDRSVVVDAVAVGDVMQGGALATEAVPKPVRGSEHELHQDAVLCGRVETRPQRLQAAGSQACGRECREPETR